MSRRVSEVGVQGVEIYEVLARERVLESWPLINIYVPLVRLDKWEVDFREVYTDNALLAFYQFWLCQSAFKV